MVDEALMGNTSVLLLELHENSNHNLTSAGYRTLLPALQQSVVSEVSVEDTDGKGRW